MRVAGGRAGGSREDRQEMLVGGQAGRHTLRGVPAHVAGLILCSSGAFSFQWMMPDLQTQFGPLG